MTADVNPAVGFIGLGSVGAKLAGTLVRSGAEVWLHDLDQSRAVPLLAQGACWGGDPVELARSCRVIVTCLPHPDISRQVIEEQMLPHWQPQTIWLEMSTTDYGVMRDLAAKIIAVGGRVLACPVSGGCHRAATGNIAILAGGARETFEAALPILTRMGRKILHVGEIGAASQLKVVTNYLATVNLVSLCEALVTCKAAGLDMNCAYEAIRVSSGNSFVHETESQVILNGSRDIGFTLGLVQKDIGLFQNLADENRVPLEMSPLLNEIIADGIARYGSDEHSPNVIRRLEEKMGFRVLGEGFPAEMVDDEPEEPGQEVHPFGEGRR